MNFQELEQMRDSYIAIARELANNISAEMMKFKGRYFKHNEDGVVKYSIFYVLPEQKWSNVIQYVRCFYCQDKDGEGWYEINKELDWEIEFFNLEKIMKAQEITSIEYNEIKNKIVQKAKEIEIRRLDEKYQEMQDKWSGEQ